jgi:modulator of FtsH protease
MQSDIRLATSVGVLGEEQHRVLRNTYWLLALTLIPTIIGAFVGVSTSFAFMRASPIMAPLLMFGLMFGLLFGVMALRNSVWGIVLLFGFTFVSGWLLGPILQYSLGFKNGPMLIGVAAGMTATVFFAMAGVATVTRKDFSFLGNFLLVGLILLIIASLANLFLAVPALSLAISAVAVLIFSMFILYEVSNIVNGGETNYVMATLSLYQSIYNLFVSLLNLLLAFSGQRD